MTAASSKRTNVGLRGGDQVEPSQRFKVIYELNCTFQVVPHRPESWRSFIIICY